MNGFCVVKIDPSVILNLRDILDEADRIVTLNENVPHGSWHDNGMFSKNYVFTPTKREHLPVGLSHTYMAVTNRLTDRGEVNYKIERIYPYQQIESIIDLATASTEGFIYLGEKLSKVYNVYG